MAFFERLGLSKAMKEYQKSMNAGDWKIAIQIANENQLSPDKRIRAEKSLKTEQEILEYNLNESSRQSIDKSLLKIEETYQNNLQTKNQDLLTVFLNKALKENRIDNAIKILNKLPEPKDLFIMLVLSKISIKPNISDLTISLIPKISDRNYKIWEVRSLFTAQLLLNNPDEAIRLAKKFSFITDQKQGLEIAETYKKLSALDTNEFNETIEDINNQQNRDYLKILFFAKKNDNDKIIRIIQSIKEKELQPMDLGTFSFALAYTGKIDQAFDLLFRIDDHTWPSQHQFAFTIIGLIWANDLSFDLFLEFINGKGNAQDDEIFHTMAAFGFQTILQRFFGGEVQQSLKLLQKIPNEFLRKSILVPMTKIIVSIQEYQ